MPTTNRRSSHSIEINNNSNNNNIGNIQQPTANDSNCICTTGAVTPAVAIMKPYRKASRARAGLSAGKNTMPTGKAMQTRKTSSAATTSSNVQRRQSEVNIELIGLVKKQPWLYDSSHVNYAKKHLVEKTWSRIGCVCNLTGAECKKRWRNIRAAFARSLNIYKTNSGANRVKSYYLYDHLKFLIKPMTMTKGRNSQKKLNESSSEDGSFEEQEDQTELQMEDNDDEEGEGERITETEGLNNDAEVSGNIASTDDIAVANNIFSATNGYSTHFPTVENGESNNNNNNNINLEAGTNQPSHDAADVTMEDSMNFSFSDNTSERNRAFDCDNISQKLTRMKKETFEDMSDNGNIFFSKSLYYDLNNLNTAQQLRLKRLIYEELEKISSINQSTTVPPLVSQTVTPNANASTSSSASLQPPLTATQKETLILARQLDEIKLQRLNRLMKFELSSNEPTARTAPAAARTNVFSMRLPNSSRIPATPECSNGRLRNSLTVKEESIDEIPPSN